MIRWKWLLSLLSVSSCALETPSPQQKEAEVRAQARSLAPTPVRMSDAEAEKKLAGVKVGEPSLCDDSCWDRDPSLFTDLDAFIASECETGRDPKACRHTVLQRGAPIRDQKAGRDGGR
jgi:hypothetical protein